MNGSVARNSGDLRRVPESCRTRSRHLSQRGPCDQLSLFHCIVGSRLLVCAKLGSDSGTDVHIWLALGLVSLLFPCSTWPKYPQHHYTTSIASCDIDFIRCMDARDSSPSLSRIFRSRGWTREDLRITVVWVTLLSRRDRTHSNRTFE
jgi:hypothetical protein